ncbi:MAG: transmission trait enhancer LetE [Legionellales bacterium]|nr:transmission trait enhancer LetE [Legionellales bacterium]
MNDIAAVLPDIKLRFNIDHPNFEECYTQGYESALVDASEEENPFGLGTKESDQWLEGWWAGFYGEPSLYLTEDSDSVTSPEDAANDNVYHVSTSYIITKVLEIAGMLALSAVVGYQIIDLVA